jgi:hypothetical protein
LDEILGKNALDVEDDSEEENEINAIISKARENINN